MNDLASRLKEHGINVEHPAGTGPVLEPSETTLSGLSELMFLSFISN